MERCLASKCLCELQAGFRKQLRERPHAPVVNQQLREQPLNAVLVYSLLEMDL